MKKTLVTAAAILALVFAAFTTGTAGQPTPDKVIGKALFYDSSFGSNGKSCDGCHGDNDSLEGIYEEDLSVVEEAALKCLRERMGGPVPEKTSLQMQSLMLYIDGEFVEPDIGC